MDFALSAEQQQLADSASRWAGERCRFDTWQAARRAGRPLADQRWPEMAALGWAAMALPEADGGLGAGPVEIGLIAQALGPALVAEPFLQNAVIGAALWRGLVADTPARAALAAELAAELAVGRLYIALAHAELHMPDDHAPPTAVARRRASGGWQLQGHKCVVMGGGEAQLIIVSACTALGPTLFALKPDTPGLAQRRYATLDAQFATDLTLHDATVPTGALWGAEGQAMPLLAQARDAALAAMGAEGLGLMELLLRLTLDHTRTRQQFGQPLAAFQVLRHRMVDMFMQVEATRSLVLLATLRLAEGDAQAPRALAAMKAKLGQAGRFVAQQAVQLHGGMGMSDDLIVGHALKRLMVLDARLGNTDRQLQRLAALPMAAA